ncbi:MAG: choice-of-anchor tandem repeat GloVer-containing protein [Bacteroidales bacterium]|jgi:uncharacterized repeat protein (TIGR03803 family)|nr:choice-of-anchor tandem repeat GloVer-containing protein [Bacteroidales bacterium]
MKHSIRITFILVLLLSYFTANSQILYWALTSKGGQYNAGTIFFTNRYGEEQQTVHSFEYSNGDSPIGSLILASDDHLYGTTPGGNIDFGTIFQFNDDNFQYKKILEFNGSTEGFHPTGQLVNYTNGHIFGMTRNGGEDQSGVIFEYVPGETSITVKKYFTGSDGAHPEGGLIIGSNGLLYGLTSYGGNFNAGVLFSFDPGTDVYEQLYDFNPANGAIPVCNLLQASNGKLYGITPKGGDFNSGVLFEYDIISDTYTKLVDFNGQNAGSEPAGSLIEVWNGILYGMAMKNEISGNDSYGTIYSYDITNYQINKLFTFDGLNGANPTGSLTKIVDGNLIGLTDKGGTFDAGVRFEFDVTDNTFIKKLDFEGENGQLPIYSALLEVSYLAVNEQSLLQNMSVYPNPASNFMYLDFKTSVESFEYKVFSMDGTLIDQGHIESNLTRINTHSLQPGTYLLQVNSDGASVSKKVFIR